MRVVLNFIWRLPVKIMNSGFSLLNMESTAAKGSAPRRRRPLHTCGASLVAIAHNASRKLQDFDGPLVSMAKRAINLFDTLFPFVYTMLHRWLTILSFVDDRILTIESKIEFVFPPSKCLFDRIDGLVCNAEALPERFDGFLKKLPMIMHQFPFLDWAICHLILWLNFLVSNLTHLGSRISAREKEITVDVNCNSLHSESDQEKANDVSPEIALQSIKRSLSLKNKIKVGFEEPLLNAESPMYSSFKSAVSSPMSDCSQDETNNPFGQITPRCSYKEILEKGKKEGIEENDENTTPHDQEKAEKYGEEPSIKQVVEMFEASWHLM